MNNKQAVISTKKPILNYMNIFRAIAIMMIVLTHCVYLQPNTFDIFVRTLVLNGTALFIFISGFLFKYLTNNFEYKKYLNKKLINVICPYLITSIVGIIYIILNTNKNPFEGLNVFLQIPLFLTTGSLHNLPTWYIPMISIYFILAPLFLYLEKIKVKKYSLLYILIPLFILLSLIFPKTIITNSDLLSITNHSYLYKWLLCCKATIYNFFNFLFVYVLGMFFASNIDNIGKLYKYRRYLLLSLVAIFLIELMLNLYTTIKIYTITKTLLSVIILVYLYKYDENIKSHTMINNIGNFLAKYSFGIFFVHCYTKHILDFILSSLKIQYVIQVNDIQSFFIFLTIIITYFIYLLLSSCFVCWIIKTILNKFNIKNTRMFIGV